MEELAARLAADPDSASKVIIAPLAFQFLRALASDPKGRAGTLLDLVPPPPEKIPTVLSASALWTIAFTYPYPGRRPIRGKKRLQQLAAKNPKKTRQIVSTNNDVQSKAQAISFLTSKDYLTDGNPITLQVLAHVLSQLGSAANKMPKALTDADSFPAAGENKKIYITIILSYLCLFLFI